MAKPMLVTLPFTLLLLDYWPLRRFPDNFSLRQLLITARPLIAEKIPLFIMAGLSCSITFVAGLKINVLSSLSSYPMPVRITNAMTSYSNYVLKTLCPNNLAIYYPHPGIMPPFDKLVVTLLFLTAATSIVLFLGRRYRHLPVGWFWFLGTFVPVIGIIQIGTHLSADRYTYVPLIGLFLLFAWSIPTLESRPRYRHITVSIITVIVLTLTVLSWAQVRHWKNSQTIFTHAIAATDENFYAHTNLGFALHDARDYEGAIEQFKTALKFNPVFYKARVKLGISLSRLGRCTEAEPHLADAIKRKPENPLGHFNLGIVLACQERYEEALPPLETAIRLFPNDPDIYYVMAIAHSGLNNFPEARAQLAKTLHIAPRHPGALELLEKLPRGNTPKSINNEPN